jgi:hypothetical protein
MDALSKLFALCAILTVMVTGLILEDRDVDNTVSVIAIGTLIASAFGGLSACAVAISKKPPQVLVDVAAYDIFEELQQGNRPRFHFYLRPFVITNRVRIPNDKRSSDLFDTTRHSQPTTYDFEQTLEDASTLRLIALGRPGEAIGAGRIETDEENWWDRFIILADAAEKIVIIPSYLSGTRREIEWLKAEKKLHKCIFLCPPAGVSAGLNLKSDWDRTILESNIKIPAYALGGKFFRVDDDGELVREVPIAAVSRAAIANAIALLESDSRQQPGVPTHPRLGDSALPFLSQYEEARTTSPFIKFLLIVGAGILIEFIRNIFK